jgi:hypothetical protein
MTINNDQEQEKFCQALLPSFEESTRGTHNGIDAYERTIALKSTDKLKSTIKYLYERAQRIDNKTRPATKLCAIKIHDLHCLELLRREPSEELESDVQL